MAGVVRCVMVTAVVHKPWGFCWQVCTQALDTTVPVCALCHAQDATASGPGTLSGGPAWLMRDGVKENSTLCWHFVAMLSSATRTLRHPRVAMPPAAATTNEHYNRLKQSQEITD